MAKQLASIGKCVQYTMHHVEPSKIRLMLGAGAFNPEQVGYRFKLVQDNCQAILVQLGKIREAAEKAGATDVLRLIDEQTVPWGHDY